jgi:hypothetical protein
VSRLLRCQPRLVRGYRAATGTEGGGDEFSQENSLPGGPWLTAFEADWGPARALPQNINYDVDDGYGIYDWSTDWFPNCKHRTTGALSAGASAMALTGPANTTVAASYAGGEQSILVASTAGWDQSHKLTIAGHADPYWVSNVNYPSAGYIRLSRYLDGPVANGAAITYHSGFAPGQQVIVMDAAPWPYYEIRTVDTVPDAYSLTLTAGLTYSRSANARVSRDWRGLSTIVADGGATALRQRLPQGFPGGYFPGKIGKHPSLAAALGRMTWPVGQSTGYLYVAAEIKLTRDDGGSPNVFTHNHNVGTKWAYIKSDASGNASLAHIICAFSGWDGAFSLPTLTDMYPAWTTQTSYGSPAYAPSSLGPAYQFPNDGAYHDLEILALPNTGSNANGTLKVWLDGVLIVNQTNCIFFFLANGMTADYTTFEPQAVYGGGLQEVPYDQSMYTRRCLVKVR